MTELSPAAQAVLGAYVDSLMNPFSSHSGTCPALSSALRAAADQVVPADGSRRNNEIRAEFLAIAVELECAND